LQNHCKKLILQYALLIAVERSIEMTIRPALREDAPAICANNIATAEETEGRILDPSIAGKGVNALFDDPSRGFYLVAERAGQVIGQCMITYEWSDWRCGNFWWIQSVYVVPEYRRTGIFSEIFREILRMAQKHPETAGIRLYVDHDNIPAMMTYASLGMHEARYILFEKEFQDFPLK
jgi:ribosomal protein S18 acetylase RimI-like enzyme